MHTRKRLDDVVGDFFFSNGISIHVARSPYFVRMTSIAVNEGEPSYVPPGDHKLKTTVLDRAHDKVGILMEQMKACWMDSGCSIIMDGWTDNSHRPRTNTF